ncbi:cytochrome P450 [Artomyces pyxidatus]|uniref:Cytochrome P450 n=1 Tax=Artomyces pyxidatus TaxID=48021 RepID=A0ACB8T771_9AGAM|nr:cytochrome P450 [Artomyces pyxidatus]
MIELSSWTVVLTAVLSVVVISRVTKLLSGLKVVNGVPGACIPFQPLGLPGALLPTSWWNPGLAWVWEGRLISYRKYKSELISYVPFLTGKPSLWTNSIEVARQTVAGGMQSTWIKPEESSRALLPWGMNLIAAEKETWRRHRRIMGPAFNPTMYSLVWSESIRIYRDMVSTEGWDKKDVIEISAVQDYTFKFAMFVISACGFGWPFAWDEPPMNEDGSMGIQKALKLYTDNSTVVLFLPEWIFKLPSKWLRDLYTAREVLREYMNKQIEDRKAEIRGSFESGAQSTGKQDVFSLLVRASEEDGKLKLDDKELVGNVFGLMFAGHETTAHTLAATLGFLGLYPDIQKDVYEEIIRVVGKDRDPAFEDFGKLEKVLSVFLESLRLYPAGYIMIRAPLEDTVLNVPNFNSEGTHAIPIQKGTQVVVDMVGVQYNPRYFPDPYKYDPSRWYGVSSESEAVTAFSIGPRTCIGRKFAATEAVCFLALLLRDWHVTPVMQPGETGEQWRERAMKADINMTLGVRSVPVKLNRRG